MRVNFSRGMTLVFLAFKRRVKTALLRGFDLTKESVVTGFVAPRHEYYIAAEKRRFQQR